MNRMSKWAIGLTAVAVGLGTLTAVTAQERGGFERGTGDRAKAIRAHQRSGGDQRGQGARLQRLIENFDTNADGDITQAEIDTARTARLAEFDANSDGALSLEEFEALWLDAMRDRMVDRFQSHDDDGDGLVTGEEFNQRFANLVSRHDQNGDGLLNTDDRRGRADR